MTELWDNFKQTNVHIHFESPVREGGKKQTKYKK